ncbi:MAG: hypothetical protein LC749_06710, partial [Actinobacteria bacterium]|nr:hypothetical protein [Actinomycetota bacterium]
RDRYTILGYLSTATKHGLDKITVLRDALTGQPWMPALPAPTDTTSRPDHHHTSTGRPATTSCADNQG